MSVGDARASRKPGPYSAHMHMALDEVLLEQVTSGKRPPTMRLWRWIERALVIGSHQSVANEVDLDLRKRLHVLPDQPYRADRDAVAEHRHAEHGAKPVALLMPRTSRVNAGNWRPSNMPSNTDLNAGMTFTMRIMRIAVATIRR